MLSSEYEKRKQEMDEKHHEFMELMGWSNDVDEPVSVIHRVGNGLIKMIRSARKSAIERQRKYLIQIINLRRENERLREELKNYQCQNRANHQDPVLPTAEEYLLDRTLQTSPRHSS